MLLLYLLNINIIYYRPLQFLKMKKIKKIDMKKERKGKITIKQGR